MTTSDAADVCGAIANIMRGLPVGSPEHGIAREAWYAALDASDFEARGHGAIVGTDPAERLAWFLFTEDVDMEDDDTAALAHLMWANPRHAGTRARHLRRARRYLDAAGVVEDGDECPNAMPHGTHEWYGNPAALRRQCPGRTVPAGKAF